MKDEIGSITDRQRTGNPALDQLLAGGLLPGTLTVVLGATGIGKTQLGIAFANEGQHQEGQRGVFVDMTSRGDSQNHRDYAQRLADWSLVEREIPTSESGPSGPINPADIWDHDAARRDVLHVFQNAGRRVTAADMDSDAWRTWKVEQARKLDQAIAFFYGNFVHGVRRCVVDGIEPVDRAAESIQFELFEYVYHQILQKEHDWVARDLFRAAYRENADLVSRHAYDHRSIGCLLLATSHETMLDDLITRPIQSGDVFSNANTIILMGKTRLGNKIGRALCVAKHRGSACDESIVPFKITESGIDLDEP